jgi:hypothetical protein
MRRVFGERKGLYKMLVGKLKRRGKLEDLGVDEKVISE